ncbi:P17/29C-like protein DDB_G0287399 [Echeneis naucrates]|uniref:P17/29C-like protein DDB_G0287399 n=1 Tax=Echeneis naucrates TaxID=173247 RepID=UPI0011137443|nr:P17/29C-like protein DDB_G0287399 [Echeneis naucrates]
MKMQNLLVGVFLGLLAVVHTTPVNTLTPIPTEGEYGFFREAMTEGFLIEDPSKPSLTPKSPMKTTTGHVTQEPLAEPEGSADQAFVLTQHGGDHQTTTVQSVSHAESSSTVHSMDSDDSSSSANQSFKSGVTSSAVLDEDNFSGFGPLTNELPDSGTGNGAEQDQYTSKSYSMTTRTVSSSSTDGTIEHQTSLTWLDQNEGSGMIDATSRSPDTILKEVPQQFAEREGSGLLDETSSVSSANTKETIITPKGSQQVLGAGPQVNPTPSLTHSGPSGWLIIVGFIVGLAALVLLCVAIATREKWNRPPQASELETKNGSLNQQRVQEMEMFLHNDQPKDNGKAAEYTVIPLDELPESFSSH